MNVEVRFGHGIKTMKNKPTKYKDFNIYLSHNSNGIYASIYKGERDIYVDCTPYRNDDESALEAARNIIDERIGRELFNRKIEKGELNNE